MTEADCWPSTSCRPEAREPNSGGSGGVQPTGVDPRKLNGIAALEQPALGTARAPKSEIAAQAVPSAAQVFSPSFIEPDFGLLRMVLCSEVLRASSIFGFLAIFGNLNRPGNDHVLVSVSERSGASVRWFVRSLAPSPLP